MLLLLTLFCICISALMYIMPLNYHSEANIAYSYGPSANIGYFINGCYIFSWIILMVKNFKKVLTKRYLPLFMFIIMASVIIFIQKYNPEWLLMTFAMGFTTLSMCFTIENP